MGIRRIRLSLAGSYNRMNLAKIDETGVKAIWKLAGRAVLPTFRK
jgi:hypothetical protein